MSTMSTKDKIQLGVLVVVLSILVSLGTSVYRGDRLQQQALTGGTSNVTGNLAVSGNQTVAGTLAVTGAQTFTGASTFSGAGTFTGAVTAGDTLMASNNAIMNNGLAVTGTVTLPTNALTASNITNITRTVTLPLYGFIECTTNGGTAILFSDGTDAHPNLVNSSTDGLGFYMSFDATSGTPDTDYVCTNFQVPRDYASSGYLSFKVGKGAETGANSEIITCQASINGAALLSAGSSDPVAGTAVASATCIPTLTSLAAGNSLGLTFHITSGGTADDAVNVYSVSFEYLATE